MPLASTSATVSENPALLARLDHFILEVPDIAAAHEAWLGGGFFEAWPVGPFWDEALTSGIALGGLNLELYQPLDREPKATHTFVFEPKTIAEGYAGLFAAGLKPKISPKMETDPELLELRGFPPEVRGIPQRICTNILPSPASGLDFFLCEYGPFLYDRLIEENTVLSIEISLPANASRILRRLGGCPLLKLVEEGPQRVLAVVTERGRIDVS